MAGPCMGAGCMSIAGRGIVLRQVDRLFGEGTLTGLGDGQLLERYLTRRDEAAFAALVDLHGPMVLGLCRRMLRDPRDIEDAFQATFLVLVRKAPAIRDRDLLSSWLHGVAHRVARRARARTLRRGDREKSVGVPEAAAEAEASDRDEIAPMLDQELGRLPERYRAPLVLCYLRGRTHEQAAEDLRCPVGTVRSRLARGRALLRDRLTRRGFVPTAVAAFLGGDATLPARLLIATVPSPLAAATVRAALGFGPTSIIQTGAAVASSAALARGVLTTMKLAQLKWIGMAVLATSLSAGGVVAMGSAGASWSTAAPAPREAPQDEAGIRPSASTGDDLKSIHAKVESLTKDNDKKTTEIVSLKQQILRMNEGHAMERENLTRLIREWRDKAERGGVKSPSPDRPTEQSDTLLKALEDKIDRLMNRLDAPTAGQAFKAVATDAFDPRQKEAKVPPPAPAPDRAGRSIVEPDTGNQPPPPRQGMGGSSPSIAELEARLKLAIIEFGNVDTLFHRAVVSASERDLARWKILIIAGQLEGLDDDARDEYQRLELERRRKQAEQEKAEAKVECAASVVARNRRVNAHKPDPVGPDEVARAEAELKVAMAESKVAQVGVDEVALRMQQLERKQARIREATKLAERFKKDAPQPEPTPPAGVNRS